MLGGGFIKWSLVRGTFDDFILYNTNRKTFVSVGVLRPESEVI